MLRRFFAALVPGCALLLASCGGNVATTPLPPPTIQSTTGATTFALNAALMTTQLTVIEAGYHGSYAATSSNTAIVTVSPAALQSSANARSAEAKIEAAGDGSGTFTLTAIQNGNATIAVTDDQQHMSSFGIVVSGLPSTSSSLPGPLSVSLATLPFNGTAQVQTVTVTDPGTTAFTASGCAGIATLGAVTNGAFTVTSVAAGSCTITVSDAFTNHATVAVGVTTLGVPIQ